MHTLVEPAGQATAGAAHHAAGPGLALAATVPGRRYLPATAAAAGSVKVFLEGLLAGAVLFGPAVIVYILKGI